MTDVFVVDRYELARHGLVDLIEKADGVTVVGESGDAAVALDAIKLADPDVVVVNIRAGQHAGVELCRALAGKCLVLSDEAGEDLMFAVIAAGAAGFLLDHASGDAVLDAIRSVADGRCVLDPAMTDRVFTRLRTVGEPAQAKRPTLTPQERQVLQYVAAGMTNLQIAHRCAISEKTVKNHVTSILRKLNISSRTQAAMYVRDGG